MNTMYLDGNLFGDLGAAAIADALLVNSSISRVSLCDNCFGEFGATAIVNVLTTNQTLTELSLFNHFLFQSHHGPWVESLNESLKWSLLGKKVRNPNITSLNLNDFFDNFSGFVELQQNTDSVAKRISDELRHVI